MIWKVGMRCRIVRHTWGDAPEHLGKDGWVSLIGMDPREDVNDGLYDCEVTMANGELACVRFHEIEPVHPERNRVVSWEECGFHPSEFPNVFA